jgi:hypothetical protein
MNSIRFFGRLNRMNLNFNRLGLIHFLKEMDRMIAECFPKQRNAQEWLWPFRGGHCGEFKVSLVNGDRKARRVALRPLVELVSAQTTGRFAAPSAMTCAQGAAGLSSASNRI